MLLTVEVTMIAFATFIVEADNRSTVLAAEQSVLEQMLAPRNGLRHFPDNGLDNRSIWQNRFEPMECGLARPLEKPQFPLPYTPLTRQKLRRTM
jgi:hypothetical protein